MVVAEGKLGEGGGRRGGEGERSEEVVAEVEEGKGRERGEIGWERERELVFVKFEDFELCFC